MNVSLTPELEMMISEKVKSGRYHSASEVVREALRLLEERDEMKEIRRQKLRHEIQKGVDDMNSGNFTSVSDTEDVAKLIEKIIDKGREELAGRK